MLQVSFAVHSQLEQSHQVEAEDDSIKRRQTVVVSLSTHAAIYLTFPSTSLFQHVGHRAHSQAPRISSARLRARRATPCFDCRLLKAKDPLSILQAKSLEPHKLIVLLLRHAYRIFILYILLFAS